jgi:hypothetical protein
MAAGAPLARKRSRTFETAHDGAADDEAHSKGGHSLRKRARIDYTQEMIDDDLRLSTTRNDSIAKPGTTPSARGRKRRSAHDGSDGESEDVTSNPKRRRADKSPVRATSSRRRNTSKKPTAGVSAYVDQPSDNDVQDTILVNVSIDQGQSDDESDKSSFQESESQPTSDDESDTAAVPAQPPTPQVPSAESIKDTVSVAPDDDEAIGKGIVPEQPDDKAQIAPDQVSLTPECDKPGRTPKKDATRIIVVSRSADTRKTASQGDSEKPVKAGPHDQISNANQPSEQPEQQQVLKEAFENAESAAPTTTEPKAAEELTIPVVSGAGVTSVGDTVIVDLPFSKPLRAANQTGPVRLKQLEHVYKSKTPFASSLNLTPYEDEDAVLPGPYTEWVYPVDGLKTRPEPTPIPTPTPTPSPLEKVPVAVEWEARRPLKTGEFFALYRQETKRRKEKGEPPISMVDFHNECVRKYKAAQSELSASETSSSAEQQTTLGRVEVNGRATLLRAALAEETPHSSQPAESQVPTAAASPVPAEEDGMPEDGVDDEQEADETLFDQPKPGSPVEPVEVTRNPTKQYSFPKLRDPSEIIAALDGWQDMGTDVLYAKVAAVVEVLHQYQLEYNELRKITDDEENAKRRQANDKTIVNWENRQKADEPIHMRRHHDDLVKGPTPFEVRGVRAPKPYIDDPILEHQREEDRIMAQAYGFKHNNHPSQVGRQNPEEQRWEMPESRLRERKRTEKGAELAEENVIEGKRARRSRYVSDQSKDVSRSETPTASAIVGVGRRPVQKRKPAATPVNGEEAEGPGQPQLTESFAETPRKGRAARSGPASQPDGQDLAIPVAEANGNQTEAEEVKAEETPKTNRKRARGAAITAAEPPTSVPAGFNEDGAVKRKRIRGPKNQQTAQTAATEIASSSFYSHPSAAASQPDSRPSTASSQATAHTIETVESAYSLRDKRKRNFALENDPELETRPQRRGRAAVTQKPSTEPKKPVQQKENTQPQPPPAIAPTTSLAPPGPPSHSNAGPFFHEFMSVPIPGMANPPHPGPPGPPLAPMPAPGPFLHTFNAAPAFPPGVPPPPPPPPSAKKPITKIKLTNNGSSSTAPSRAATPANGTSSSNSKAKRVRTKKASSSVEPTAGAAAGPAAGATAGATAGADVAVPGANGEPDKPYAEMTKSEKMSWSMRRKSPPVSDQPDAVANINTGRWATGEMQGAVEKRRATLASKKAEKAQGSTTGVSGGADSNDSGQATEPNSASPSGPTTPASMTAGQTIGSLALPQGPQQAQQQQQQQQAPVQSQAILQQPSLAYTLSQSPSGPA